MGDALVGGMPVEYSSIVRRFEEFKSHGPAMTVGAIPLRALRNDNVAIVVSFVCAQGLAGTPLIYAAAAGHASVVAALLAGGVDPNHASVRLTYRSTSFITTTESFVAAHVVLNVCARSTSA